MTTMPGTLPPAVADRLRVTGLEIFGHHGVFDSERRDGQTFVIDLELGLDVASAARSDDLADTVDYGGLVGEVVQAVQTDPVNLIETLAERIAQICLGDPRVQWTEVTVHKPGAPIEASFADVTLTIQRRR